MELGDYSIIKVKDWTLEEYQTYIRFLKFQYGNRVSVITLDSTNIFQIN